MPKNKAKFNKKLGDLFTEIFTGVEETVLHHINDGSREEEDHITSEVLTLLEERINNRSNKGLDGIRVWASQFSGRGPNSNESVTGADGALILEVPCLELRKYFVFQAKKFRVGERSRFDERSIEQKWKMLAYTADSFFLVYTPERFYWVSAFMVGLNDKVRDVPCKNFSEFCQDFFNCFIGDRHWHPQFPWFRTLPSKIQHELLSAFKKIEFTEKSPLAKRNLCIRIEKI